MATKKKTAPAKGRAKKGKPAAAGGSTRPARGKRPAAAAAARKRPAAARKAARREEAQRPAGPPENPRALALARRVGQLVADKKALDVVILDVRGKTSYADYFVIASGESDRQVSAMGEHVRERLKHAEGTSPMGQEGSEGGQWVLLDYGEVVVHLFQSETRAFYDLDGLWADASREKVA